MKRTREAPTARPSTSGHQRHITWRLATACTAALGAAVLLAACSSRTSTAGTSTTAASAPSAPRAVSEAMTILTGKEAGRSGWPKFTNSSWTVKAGETVTLTITNHDDGAAPLTSAMAVYDKVTGGTETVDGTPVSSEPNADVSHTFTVPDLGINVVIPAAPTGGTNTIVFTFTPTKRGTFTWHCFAPCGSGADGMGGAMATDGWMMGNLTVS